jgi:hypothetical protein
MDQANQDAIYCHAWPDGLVAVVCDGCGSAPHSGMGAALGCRLTAGALVRRQDILAQAVNMEDAERYLAAVEADVLAALSAIVDGCPGEPEQTIHDCLLFTVLGISVCGEHALLFALGDGVIGYNGAVEELGPYPGNAPPYLGYALLAEGAATTPRSARSALVDNQSALFGAPVQPRPTAVGTPAVRPYRPTAVGGPRQTKIPERDDAMLAYSLTCHAFLPIAELDTAVIGTDGVGDAMRGAAQPLPGTNEPFGPLSQFWEDDRYLRNPDLLRRRMARAARAVPGCPAILSDDTSLVVMRRERCA